MPRLGSLVPSGAPALRPTGALPANAASGALGVFLQVSLRCRAIITYPTHLIRDDVNDCNWLLVNIRMHRCIRAMNELPTPDHAGTLRRSRWSTAAPSVRYAQADVQDSLIV